MPIARAAELRNAEKLIRQGRLPDAIAEYVCLVEDQPGHWNLANSLGDLYAGAFAVCMELQSGAGSYRDVDERIERLTTVQAGS